MIEILELCFTDIGDIRGGDFGSKFGVADVDDEFLYMNRSEDALTNETL